MQLGDPLQNRLPTGDSNLPPVPGNRFTPSPLSQTAIAFLKRSLDRNRRRRSVYRAHHLRVYSDGKVHVQLSLMEGITRSFHVPLSASYLEVFGDDSEGPLLLGVFHLPEPAMVEEDHPLRLFVTLEGGQTLAVEIALGYGSSGELSEYVIRIVYAEAPGLENR
jgi:hypothetical protein